MKWLLTITLTLVFIFIMPFGASVPADKAVDGQIPLPYFFKEPNKDHSICEGESFQAACAENEVIIIESAIYGRMAQGRCVPSWDTASLGCLADVQDVAGQICSEQQSCEMRMPLDTMVAKLPCPKGLRAYLQIRYSCLAVLMVSQEQCYLPVQVHINREQTVIASSLVTKRGCEVFNLQADVGQHLQLAIVDFAMTTLDERQGEGVCTVKYGEFITGQKDGKQDICKRLPRDRVLMEESVTNEVQLLLNRDAIRQGAQFLLKIKALGCQNISPPVDAWVRREGNEMVIGCQRKQDVTWTLQCQNGRWAGVIGNCTMAADLEQKVKEVGSEPNTTFTEKVWIFGIACMAFITCVTVIVIGIVCMKRLKVQESGRLCEYQQQMQTVARQQMNTLHCEPTYAVYDRIPCNQLETLPTRINEAARPLVPGFDTRGKSLM